MRRLLAGLPEEALAAALTAVPALTSPAAAARSLAWLGATFPGQDPVGVLAADPGRLLAQMGEADEQPDAEYGVLQFSSCSLGLVAQPSEWFGS